MYDGVHNGHTLGEGAEGVVRRCTHRETGVQFAAKCLNIGLIEDEKIIETLREEIFIMCQSDHPDIIRLEEVYESEDQIYLIMNLLTGGDMFDRLEEQSDYHYSEHRCANIVKQMIRSVRYLHANKVIHRDLKLGMLEHVAAFLGVENNAVIRFLHLRLIHTTFSPSNFSPCVVIVFMHHGIRPQRIFCSTTPNPTTFD